MNGFDIRLYAADVKCLNDEDLLENVILRLGRIRKEKAEKIRNPAGRRLSAGAGLLLKKALQDIEKDTGVSIFDKDGDIPMTTGENGKPYLKEPCGNDQIFFNLSHSGDMVICALAPCEVGCDIEHIRPGREKIAERYFTEEERVFAELSERNFFRMWTLKESFMKVTGKGLLLTLDSFSVKLSEEGISVTQTVNNNNYTFREYSVSDSYCCSVCAAGGMAFEEKVRNCDIRKII